MELMHMSFENGLVINVLSNILTIKEKKTQEEYIRTCSSAWQEGDYIELINLMPKITQDLMALARDYLAQEPSHHVIDVLHLVVDGNIFNTQCVDFKALAQWLVYHTNAFGNLPYCIQDNINFETLAQEIFVGDLVYTCDSGWVPGVYIQGENDVIGVVTD